MNRLRKRVSEYAFLNRSSILTNQLPKTPKSIVNHLAPIQFHRECQTLIHPSNQETTDWLCAIPEYGKLRTQRSGLNRATLYRPVSTLKCEILKYDDIDTVLEEKGADLFKEYGHVVVVLELLDQLREASPRHAIQVLNWRRKQCQSDEPMTLQEYVKGILVAGKGNEDINLAIELFEEAAEKKVMDVVVYNALMTACNYIGLPMKCQSVFQQLKEDPSCTPSVVSYTLLIYALGRLMLTDHMEAAFLEMNDRNLSPTRTTYHALITGYITAWNWEAMEKTYQLMKDDGPIKPDVKIQLLMLRGYAISGNLEKMEQMFEMVKHHVLIKKEFNLIRTIIAAYCRSSLIDEVDKVDKVEELVRLIPENEHMAWFEILLITLYANADLFEKMKKSINGAFQRKTCIASAAVMRCIIAGYFRQNAVDELADFVQRAEDAGWKLCRSLYHCKMVMYSDQKRVSEMERVLEEMGKINMPVTKKTFWILYKGYHTNGERYKLETLVGWMYKGGYDICLDTCLTQ